MTWAPLVPEASRAIAVTSVPKAPLVRKDLSASRVRKEPPVPEASRAILVPPDHLVSQALEDPRAILAIKVCLVPQVRRAFRALRALGALRESRATRGIRA